MTHHIAKITEIVGSSEKGWEEAAQVALDEAKKTIREITGIEVVDMTATVDPNTGSITKYKTTIKIAFKKQVVCQGWRVLPDQTYGENEDKVRAAVIPKVRSRWQVEEVPVPKPATNQVLIKIHASGLCYSDVHLTNGDLPFSLPFPLTAGHELVGEN